MEEVLVVSSAIITSLQASMRIRIT